jgi:hypothetical protein
MLDGEKLGETSQNREIIKVDTRRVREGIYMPC